MTDLRQSASTACPACGAAFACDPQSACWCKDETYRLPMPDRAAAARGCLCPACLREIAAGHAAAKVP